MFLKLLLQLIRRAASRAAWTAGNNSPTKIPMMAITTKSSTSVKALRVGWVTFTTMPLWRSDVGKNFKDCRLIANAQIEVFATFFFANATQPKCSCQASVARLYRLADFVTGAMRIDLRRSGNDRGRNSSTRLNRHAGSTWSHRGDRDSHGSSRQRVDLQARQYRNTHSNTCRKRQTTLCEHAN